MNTEIKINLSKVLNKPLSQVYLSDSQMAISNNAGGSNDE